MKRSARADDTGLRVMIILTAFLFMVMGSGCGASHVGQIVGMDPAPDVESPAAASAAPATP